jgi:hypothetical protein
MGNVNMPAPVALAGAGLCLLGGYLVGTVAGHSAHAESTAEVQSYDASTDRLCLAGGAVADDADAKDGVLCGTWRHDAGAQRPEKGDDFRFVSMTSTRTSDDEKATFIFGEVVR